MAKKRASLQSKKTSKREKARKKAKKGEGDNQEGEENRPEELTYQDGNVVYGLWRNTPYRNVRKPTRKSEGAVAIIAYLDQKTGKVKELYLEWNGPGYRHKEARFRCRAGRKKGKTAAGSVPLNVSFSRNSRTPMQGRSSPTGCTRTATSSMRCFPFMTASRT